MRRVVVTGLGIVSSIGNNANEVQASLREGRSGISFSSDYAERGFRSHVYGRPTLDPSGMIEKRVIRFMGEGAAWAHIAMEQAILDSGLEKADISNERTGLIVGSGGPSTHAIVAAADITREKGAKRVGPFAVPKAMSSTMSATLATPFEIKGWNYSISSACATSSHCIGNAAELIQWGKQDVMFAGGGEELDWTLSVLFDAMGAMSSRYNETPSRASRAFDRDRDGFVIAGGAGILVLEELEHAKARGAKIYCELAGYGRTCDGHHITAPDPDATQAARGMRLAFEDAGLKAEDIDYVNAHGTSTSLNDKGETLAIKKALGMEQAYKVAVSSTKSMTGHMLGAAGGVEAIACAMAIHEGIIPPTINYETPDPDCDLDYVPNVARKTEVRAALSNSLGFGGHNATLCFKKA